MEREHQLSVVLADETRYRIYRSIAEQPHDVVTVAEVAQQFGLHPNVARMHLGKLEQAGLLATGLRRRAAAGPAALLAERPVVSFDVPPRRYDLLSSLAVESLAQRGSATTCCASAATRARRRPSPLAGEARPPAEGQPGRPRAPGGRAAGSSARGPLGGDELDVRVRNCVFREIAAASPTSCARCIAPSSRAWSTRSWPGARRARRPATRSAAAGSGARCSARSRPTVGIPPPAGGDRVAPSAPAGRGQ